MKQPALLIIDVQKGLDDPKLGQRNNPDAEANMARLLHEWRQNKRPIIHIKHDSVEPQSPLRPDLPGNEIKDEVKPLPEEPLFSKTVNSAFIGTNLEGYLHEQKIESLVVVGLTTAHCVSTSTRMAANLGFDVTLVSDATATHERVGVNGRSYSAEELHEMELALLNEEFCAVRTTDEVLG
ncbi:MAG: cysteine hydrolase family protein [Chloroflexota bacterium]